MLEMRNGFYKTDDDCMQCCKEVMVGKFFYIQVIWLDTTSQNTRAENRKDDTDNYVVVSKIIDVMEMSNGEKENAISGFYDNTIEVEEQYGDDTDKIIAECYFENIWDESGYDFTSGVVSWEDAEKIIQKFIDTNGNGLY